MSFESIVYGFIQGATWHQPHFRLLQKANLRVLRTLPIHDERPALTRDMFWSTPLGSSGTFIHQVIHFGGSINALEWGNVPVWIEKFESLLRRLYWIEATAHVWTDYIDGAYQFWWKIADDALPARHAGVIEPTAKWTKKRLHLVRESDGPPSQPWPAKHEQW